MAAFETRKIFISHATRDLPRLRGLVHLLKALGHRTFVASDDIPAGVAWQTTLERELLRSDVVLVLWTKNATRSEWVAREYTMALEQDSKRVVIPLILDDDAVLPGPLAARQAIALPLVQDLIDERRWVLVEGGDRTAMVQVVDEVLRRHRIDLPRWQRRDVIVFVGGMAMSLGIWPVISSFLNRPAALATKSNVLVAMVIGGVLGMVPMLLPSGSTERASGRFRVRLGAPEGTLGDLTLLTGSASSGEDGAPQGPRIEFEQVVSEMATISPHPHACSKARDAAEAFRRVLRDPSGLGAPVSHVEATRRYAMPVYTSCRVETFELGMNPVARLACETPFDSTINAMTYSDRVIRALTQCATPSLWSRKSVSGFSGGKIERKAVFRNTECASTRLTLDSGPCRLVEGTGCARIELELAGELQKCLRV